jgi:hypothetical protein
VTLKVGQVLWFVPNEIRRNKPEAVTVEKIGRKWAHIGNGARADLDTLVVDGGVYTSPGRCWLHKEAWEAETRRQDAWLRLRQGIERHRKAPDGLSLEQIERAAAVLTSRT